MYMRPVAMSSDITFGGRIHSATAQVRNRVYELDLRYTRLPLIFVRSCAPPLLDRRPQCSCQVGVTPVEKLEGCFERLRLVIDLPQLVDEPACTVPPSFSAFFFAADLEPK